jgi:two-component system alkaline phosphatase synthesis response regulator PhoP
LSHGPGWPDADAAAVAAREGAVMRLLITEDDAALGEALQFSLTQAGYAVDRVANGAAADEALKDDVFGLLILDLGLPKLDGFEVLRRVRRRNTALPVLILSGRENPEEKVLALDLGADDYLVKPFSPRELVARVKALLRRPRTAALELGVDHGGLRIDPARREVLLDGKALRLTLIEFDLLAALARDPGLVLSRQQLLDRVWGPDFYGDDHLLDVHVGNLRRKLGEDPDRSRWIETVRGVGFRFVEPETRR